MEHGIEHPQHSLTHKTWFSHDFWILPNLKIPLTGKTFEDIKEIKRNVTR